MAKRAKKPDEKPEAIWLTSYADLVTAMFALFVILFALSDINEERFANFAMAASGRDPLTPLDFGSDGINNLLGSGLFDLPMFDFAIFVDPGAGDGQYDNEGNQIIEVGPGGHVTMEMAADVLETYFMDSPFWEQVDVRQIGDNEILISFYDNMFFNSGSAAILPPTFPVLDIVFEAFMSLLAEHPNLEIRIEGHTDNVPINTVQFPSNWELSGARAVNIARHLVNLGTPSYRTSFQGFGEYRPVGDNTTEAGRQLNRRVEIRIFDAIALLNSTTIGGE